MSCGLKKCGTASFDTKLTLGKCTHQSLQAAKYKSVMVQWTGIQESCAALNEMLFGLTYYQCNGNGGVHAHGPLQGNKSPSLTAGLQGNGLH